MSKRNGFLRANKGSLTLDESPLTRRGALLQFPPCVYAARLHDGCIKIGWTEAIYRRLTELGPSPELLAINSATD